MRQKVIGRPAGFRDVLQGPLGHTGPGVSGRVCVTHARIGQQHDQRRVVQTDERFRRECQVEPIRRVRGVNLGVGEGLQVRQVFWDRVRCAPGRAGPRIEHLIPRFRVVMAFKPTSILRAASTLPASYRRKEPHPILIRCRVRGQRRHGQRL